MRLKIIVTLTLTLNVFYWCGAQDVRIQLVNCSLDKEALAHIQNSLSYQLRFYSTIFNQPADTSFRAIVFGSEKEFVKYAKTKSNFNPLKNHSIAFYDPTLNEMILHRDVQEFPKVFAHEVSHAILNYYCKYATTWLDEGLAMFLEDIVANDSAYYIASTQEPKVAAVKALFLQGGSIKEPMNTRNFYQEPANFKNYRLSFAVVLYLFQARRDVLANIVRSNCDRVYNMFDYYYPEGLDLLQVDVKSFFLNYNPTLN